ALIEARVSELLAHAQWLVAEGLRYIEPREESRRVFSQVRDQLVALRGDLNTAIERFSRHVRQNKGTSQQAARIQLARLLLERAEHSWIRGDRGRANRDLIDGEHHLYEVLQDPARRLRNIKLWYDCARHLTHWARSDLIERLLQLHAGDPDSLDAAVLLMAMFFAEAVETGSPEAWRRCEEFQRKSAQRS